MFFRNSFSAAKDKDKEKDKDSKDKLKKKDGGSALDSRELEFEELLKSGETVVLSLTPKNNAEQQQTSNPPISSISVASSIHSTAIQMGGAGTAIPHPNMNNPEAENTIYEDTIFDEPTIINEEGVIQENKRLEARIQELNSELFKERDANRQLSDGVKELLQELEESNASNASLTEQLESAKATQGNAVPGGNQSESDEWKQKYIDLEEKSNALSLKAFNTIQEAKTKILNLQRENITLADKLRSLREELQKRDNERTRAMALIPQLLGVIKGLEEQLEQERTKKELEKGFDDLTQTIRRTSIVPPKSE